MKKLLILLLLFTSISVDLFSQTVSGLISDAEGNALPGATVQIRGTTFFELSDSYGKFTIKMDGQEPFLVISYVGYATDTIEVVNQKFLRIELTENIELEEVVVKGSNTFIDPLSPQVNEVILEGELLKAACCNLSESFETNASVDVSFSDAVTGTRTIKMLGLDGKYVYMLREDIPMIRGLISNNGLTFVPGTWLQTIDVGKGAGSVANGYESMTGQINLDFKKPEGKEKLYLNAYVNAASRTELNVNYATKISDKVSTAILGHVNFLPATVDRNNDGFMDLPMQRQVNVLNRYRIDGERTTSQIGFQLMQEEKTGGQNGFKFGENPNTSSLYGITLKSRRFELFGKTGFVFPDKPYKGWGVLYSASINTREDKYGSNTYQGEEKSLYGNVIHQGIIDNTFHQYRTGVSFIYDNYDESLNDSTFTRNEIVPGGFFEYSYSGPFKWSVVGGIRTDYHNLYGWLVNPRLHFQYGFTDESAIRFSAGRGVRVPNVIAENTSLLASSRSFIVSESVDPEVSWNIGGSINQNIKIGEKDLLVVLDYFHTKFENQLVVDRDQNVNEVNFYNLDGSSFANSFQVEVKYDLLKNLEAKAAYKYYNVKTTYSDFGLRDAPFIPKDRVFFNLEYATYYDKWVFDLTGQWYGIQRIPDTDQNPSDLQRPQNSPSYFVMNGQVKRAFRWGSVYLGGENLLNFKQDNPIIDPEDPFGSNFDATLVWGPIMGRMIYAGIRYRINK